MRTDAIFSPDRKYRYALYRIWNEKKPFVMFVGLNPSTANEKTNDPTVARCVRFADSWDYGGMVMTNTFAYVSTDPNALLAIPDTIGLENNSYLAKTAKEAGIIVCAWGYFPRHIARQTEVLNMLRSIHPVYHLGLTKEGWPRHPLYLKKDVQPQEWRTEQGQHGAKDCSRFKVRCSRFGKKDGFNVEHRTLNCSLEETMEDLMRKVDELIAECKSETEDPEPLILGALLCLFRGAFKNGQLDSLLRKIQITELALKIELRLETARRAREAAGRN